MNGLIFIVIGIIAILVILGIILTIIALKKKEVEKFKEPDYKVFFFMGINFIPIGLCYMVIGLANKNKWERKQ